MKTCLRCGRAEARFGVARLGADRAEATANCFAATGGASMTAECLSFALAAEKAKNVELRALVEQSFEELFWCSGSPDFNEHGQAREGWLIGPAVLLPKLRAVIDEGKP